MATLERRGSTFGDITLTQFDDPLLAEHALYLAVVDIPKRVSVRLARQDVSLPLSPFLLSPLLFISPSPFSLFLPLHLPFLLPPSLPIHILLCPQMVEFVSTRLIIHVFQLHEDGPAAEELDTSCDVSAASHWMLPNGQYTGCLVRLYDWSVYH